MTRQQRARRNHGISARMLTHVPGMHVAFGHLGPSAFEYASAFPSPPHLYIVYHTSTHSTLMPVFFPVPSVQRARRHVKFARYLTP
jgi:hypothetical protein